MRWGEVIGRTTATVKHASLEAQPLILVQPLDAVAAADGDPMVAIDAVGSRQGDRVLMTSDGRSVRKLLEDDKAPARWAIIGIIND
ncbi:MAG TPA: ethanolamine utilization protein EutN [Planctomycetaceae bacterium]|nr:ethanolamine utilization protein EutN [Planctomycetaceae bacterium]HCD02616.1 ethanolamine utilization protein EutN [Planctomycetaceae bacterium]|tara:strand:- start:574 stop:831 length:258 start_codon:yes stop_codon:yes gene_type:complete